MEINEIFYSLQGEGRWAGLPNIFIRTTGCNLRCSFCDTKNAYKYGKKISINAIISEIQKFPCTYICVTGGEPLLQDETKELIDILLRRGYKICLETNGSISIEKFVGRESLMISLDIKTPSSKMHEKMDFKNLSYLTKRDQLKFVIKNREDYEYAKEVVTEYDLKCIVFFQPVWLTNPELMSSWILNDGLDVRLGLQLHKIIWGDIKGI